MRASELPSALRSTSSCACAVSTAWVTFALPNVKSRPAICTVDGGGSWTRTRGEYA